MSFIGKYLYQGDIFLSLLLYFETIERSYLHNYLIVQNIYRENMEMGRSLWYGFSTMCEKR